VGKMAASCNKQKRDLLTEEDISKVLDKEAKSEDRKSVV
jgi:hypothetical protein